MSDLAAARLIAQLTSREFSSGVKEHPEIDAELATKIVRIARVNKLLKPVLKQFQAIGVPLPEEVKPDVAVYLRRSGKKNAKALATLREVTRKFSEAGILHAAFKGPVRQILLGQDVFERPAADVDILVKYDDFARATALLKEMGYWIPLFCDSPWWRHYLGEHALLPDDPNRLGVDLHHRTQQPSCPRPRHEEAMLNDLAWTEIGGERIPGFGPTSIFLNTVMSIVKGLTNHEPVGQHVLDLARQLHAADGERLAAFDQAARYQALERSYAFARRAVIALTGVSRVPTEQWVVPDDTLVAMLITPWDPSIQWPRHRQLLWDLVDGDSWFSRAMRFTREIAWWTAAELTRRTHDVSRLPARMDEMDEKTAPAPAAL
ncbi:MAG TPA: nucleotidyltransferase family protein [Sphingomicrobium sp.]|nr:nucleotidyltransferase family protein [Sphingomicrobium sp.]